jgi:hypothetical protein
MYNTMAVQFYASQIDKETETPLSYTGSPWKLLRSDLWLVFYWSPYLVDIFLPLWSCPSGDMDELYLSAGNIRDIGLHLILIIAQVAFLISLLFLSIFPFSLYITYFVAFLVLNKGACFLLNGTIPDEGLRSAEDNYSNSWEPHDDERWIFLNGIAVGYVTNSNLHQCITSLSVFTGNTGCRTMSTDWHGHFTAQLQECITKRIVL